MNAHYVQLATQHKFMLPKVCYPARLARTSNSDCCRRVPAEENRSWAHQEEMFESVLLQEFPFRHGFYE